MKLASLRNENVLVARMAEVNSGVRQVTLAISIVVFESDPIWLTRTLTSLASALVRAQQQGVLSGASISLIDNAASGDTSLWSGMLDDVFAPYRAWSTTRTLSGLGNPGYGRANNLALSEAPPSDYVLVINPDVDIDRDGILAAITYLSAHPECGMVTPVAMAADGSPLFLVKDNPRVFTLAIRGFAPAFVHRLFRQRLAEYERAAHAFDSELDDVRIASGCFMFMRRDVFEKLGGFDPGFFLYFEDFDLTRRISETHRIVRLPACRIVHGGGNASRKSWRHAMMFMRSAFRFFNKHGWRW